MDSSPSPHRLEAYSLDLDGVVSRIRSFCFHQQLETVHIEPRRSSLAAAAPSAQPPVFHLVEGSLAAFLAPDYLDACVRKRDSPGQLLMLPHRPCADAANTCALSHGELTLAVNSETYKRLGLVGKKIRNRLVAEPDRYVISIDLSADTFRPGEKRFDRTLACLDSCLAPGRFLVSCPGMGAEAAAGLTTVPAPMRPSARAVRAIFSRHRTGTAPVPELERPSYVGKLAACDPQTVCALHAWLGAVCARASATLASGGAPPNEAYLSTFGCGADLPFGGDVSHEGGGEEAQVEGRRRGTGAKEKECACERWQGLLPVEFVEGRVRDAHATVASGRSPWAAVVGWGPPDAACAWRFKGKARVHGYGANHYTVVILPSDQASGAGAAEARAAPLCMLLVAMPPGESL